MKDTELDAIRQWLAEFHARKGRPLRVLHIGNIAANAYLNAKFLRRIGVEADVVSHDYDHVMAFPEWEDVELKYPHGDDNAPHFDPRDLVGYQRPEWFIHGSLSSCVHQVRQRYNLAEPRVEIFKLRVAAFAANSIRPYAGATAANIVDMAVTRPGTFLLKAFGKLRRGLQRRRQAWLPDGTMRSYILRTGRLVVPPPLRPWVKQLLKAVRTGSTGSIQGIEPPAQTAFESTAGASKLLRFYRYLWPSPARLMAKTSEQIYFDLCSLFHTRFPDRADILTRADLLSYGAVAKDYAAMFEPYDIVQCYATEPVNALITNKRPYVAFEHGTLRDFTMGDHPLHRLTALAYREADHTFITNGDCLEYAGRLGIERFSPMIHPIDVEQHRFDFGDEIEKLRGKLDADVMLFCPVRHDWKAKGTDLHLRAMPHIMERTRGKIRLVLAEWGAQLDESRRLIEQLGFSDNVVWRKSMCRISMIKMIRASDVVLDQMALPHFGSTAPQSLAAGVPVISSYKAESTDWIMPEPAPIIPAFSPRQIADAVEMALDKSWRNDFRIRAAEWIDKYHHPDRVVREHLTIYREVLKNEQRCR